MGVLPTAAEAMFSLQRALELLPSPPLDLGASWLDTWNTGQDLTTREGKDNLLDHLTDAHNCADSEWLFPWEDDCPDDDGALWLGVVPGIGGGIASMGKNTAWAGSVSDRSRRVSGGHEIGHMLCLRHVNQGCDGTNPAKDESCDGGDDGFDELPAGGLVLHVAFDPYYNDVVSFPRYDFMTYACNRWISEANWNRLYAGALR